MNPLFFKKSSVCVLAFCLLCIGCSEKEQLHGERENIVLSEDIKNSSEIIDRSPVIIDSGSINHEFSQRFMNHTHYYAPLNFSTSPENIWTVKLDYESSKAIRITSSPIIADGKIFCIDAGGIVYAVDQKTGAQIWRTSTTLVEKDGQIGGAIAYCNDRLIVTSSFSECFSLEAKTGKILWRIKIPAPCKGDGITIYEGKAFISCSNSSLHVIDVSSGKILWSHSGTITDSSYIGSASVAIDDGIVFVAYQSGEIYALLLETGVAIWDTAFSKISLTNAARAFAHPRACPVVKNGIVYFVAANEQTSAFGTKTGKRLWVSSYGGLQTPTVSGNSIFIFNSRSELVCLNRYSGVLRWISHLDPTLEEPHNWYGQILVRDHLAMLSPNGNLSFVSVYDGKVKKMIKINEEEISVNPVIADSIMYILSSDRELSAYK
jgi:outer membrane protein assembly factor BamB